MRSSAERLRVTGGALVLAGGLALVGCGREVEIYDAPDASVAPVEHPRPDGPLDTVDVEFNGEAAVPCAERGTELCTGANDFVCVPEAFIATIVADCYALGGCLVDGWVEIELGAGGCAVELRMESPDPDFAACVVEHADAGRCACGLVAHAVFLGYANDGCPVDDGPSG